MFYFCSLDVTNLLLHTFFPARPGSLQCNGDVIVNNCSDRQQQRPYDHPSPIVNYPLTQNAHDLVSEGRSRSCDSCSSREPLVVREDTTLLGQGDMCCQDACSPSDSSKVCLQHVKEDTQEMQLGSGVSV